MRAFIYNSGMPDVSDSEEAVAELAEASNVLRNLELLVGGILWIVHLLLTLVLTMGHRTSAVRRDIHKESAPHCFFNLQRIHTERTQGS